ncbi:MAG: hypothetical protein HQL69_16675 [Magnetococcales bacterium]|nr:hypothetical protein [Magnetococcales bacterium]
MRNQIIKVVLFFVLFFIAPNGLQAGKDLAVTKLNGPVQIDGKVDEWSKLGSTSWQNVILSNSDWRDSTNVEEEIEDIDISVKVGSFNERVYFALRWKDSRPDVAYKPWKLRGRHYKRRRSVDDMLVLRFRLGDVFSECMLINKPYVTDLWRWSAGRSNISGFADDMIHRFSNVPFDSPSMEYQGDRGLLYFQKNMDSGSGGWKLSKRPVKGGEYVVSGVNNLSLPTGSRADVAAKGVWSKGFWYLEMSRAFKTGDDEDVVFSQQTATEFQIGVFHPGYKLRKFISKTLRITMNN